MNIILPEFSLVVLIGATGSGKSTFAHNHFLSTEVISSDFCRGLVIDNENDQTISQDAFDVVHYLTRKRLKNKKLTVIDATNVQSFGRKHLIQIAREYHALPVAIVLDIPERVCIDRNKTRADRNFGNHVIKSHRRDLRRSLKTLKREGFRRVYKLKSVEEIESITIERERLWNDLTHEHGPFDIIGDVHGCFDELVLLLEKLGHRVDDTRVYPANNRKLVFVGDLVDRGLRTPDVLRLVMGMVADNTAICVPGNHDVKLLRALKGRNVQRTHGLAESLAQLEQETDEFRQEVVEFLNSLISHYILDDGKLVVAHAGMNEDMAGRASGAVREFALYGETTGETDEFGLPIRYNWASDYRGNATVVYGHTPIPDPEWINRTINIDTGCVFGGALTALRYPENELVSITALHTYAEPMRPFLAEDDHAPSLSSQQRLDDILDIEDVMGKRIINTRLRPNITVREENATAALEVMSRFTINPKWLIYLPPTMSPTETSKITDLLEHPNEAFAYYRNHGVPQVICEEKHMGSRAIAIVCQNTESARERFGVEDGKSGVIYTRTGRPFFTDETIESTIIERIQLAMSTTEMWDKLSTDWVVLDCELMPWSDKAQGLIQKQYAAVGAAGQSSIHEVLQNLQKAQSNSAAVDDLIDKFTQRQTQINLYQDAYRRYCWTVETVEDYKLAPFHILATEGDVHINKSHVWHMETIAEICQADPAILLATAYRLVDITDENSQADAIRWWETLTASGGEGMVIKSLDFVARGARRQILQPALKCRGREYLRIIYGAEYTNQLAKLRRRNVKRKSSLASREFALSIESLERFVRKEPLRRTHECVFGVLALESEPVDPRL